MLAWSNGDRSLVSTDVQTSPARTARSVLRRRRRIGFGVAFFVAAFVVPSPYALSFLVPLTYALFEVRKSSLLRVPLATLSALPMLLALLFDFTSDSASDACISDRSADAVGQTGCVDGQWQD